jgi:hypothetical protein
MEYARTTGRGDGLGAGGHNRTMRQQAFPIKVKQIRFGVRYVHLSGVRFGDDCTCPVSALLRH